MGALAIVGFVLAVINPVIGGVLVGYLVWRNEPEIGFQIMMLALTVFSFFVIGFIIWSSRKIKRLEKTLQSITKKDS